MILLRTFLKACLVYYFKVTIQSLDHLFNIIWTPVHKLICEESFALILNALVHFIGLFHILKIVLRLIVLLSDVIELFFPLNKLLVDISPKSIIST